LTSSVLQKYLEILGTEHYLYILSAPPPQGAVDLSTLISRWRGRTPSELHILLLFSQILTGLDCLHSHSPPLVHGNLTPRTIYVTPTNSVRLSDFGLRQIVAPVGKIAIDRSRVPPPEESIGQCDIRSDVWALGAILYHICTGLPLTTIRAIPRIPPDLNALILEMLNSDPSARPTVAQIGSSPFLRGYFEWLLAGHAPLRIPKIGGAKWRAIAAPDDTWEGRERGCPPPKERSAQSQSQSQLAQRSATAAPKIAARGPWVTSAVGAVASPPRVTARAATSARRTRAMMPHRSPDRLPESGPVRVGRRERERERTEEDGPSWAWDLPDEIRKHDNARDDARGESGRAGELEAFRAELAEIVGRLAADQGPE
jgi:hypothetical protein